MSAKYPGLAMAGARTWRREWSENWQVVPAALMGMMMLPVLNYTMGVFLEPLQQEMGWTRTEITAGLTAQGVIIALLSPVIGIAIDKVGPRKIGLTGIVLFCPAFAALGMVSSTAGWFTTWIAIGFVGLLVSPTVWTAAIAGRFDLARGSALSISLCGTGIVGIFIPAYANFLIDDYGWRVAYGVIGITLLIAALPVVCLLFYGQTDLARTSGAGEMGTEPRVGRRALVRLAFSPLFLRLASASFLFMAASSALLVHFVPMLMDRGMDRGDAAVFAGVVGAASLTGRFLTGCLFDRVRSRLIGAISFLFPALACVILFTSIADAPAAVAAAIFIGLGLGAELDVVAYLTSRYFSMSAFGFLFGIIIGLMNLGIALGPLAAAALFDVNGSYRAVYLIAGVMVLLSSLFVISLGAFPGEPRPAKRNEGRAGARA